MTLCAVVCAGTLGAQQPASYSYDFRAMGRDGEPSMTGTVRVHGNRGRIDVAGREAWDDGEYLLLSADGSVVTVVRPAKRTFSVLQADRFAHLASDGLGVAASVITLRLRESFVHSEHLGAGERIAGRATQHVRLVERWRMDVGAMGFTEPVSERVETDYLFDPTLVLARNPLLEILATAAIALPSSDAAFAARADSVRRSLVRGTPLRTVITVRGRNGGTERTVLEVTRYAPAVVDDAELRVPAGYTRRDDELTGFRRSVR